ncbi:MAG: DNA-binding GntR family transcriptional regulator [Flavobacteriales bacterium]|jgi:DNA-binding GntR family transcriptional regulator
MNTPIEEVEASGERSLSRVEQVYRKIKSRILNNEYPAGHQVLEPELAIQLGVSRTPVREALIRLASDKLILLIPRRGMKVLPIEIKDIKELLPILSSLEATAIEVLCEEPSAEAISQLQDCVESMEACLAENDSESWLQYDGQYRETLAALSGNSRLQCLTQYLLAQLHRAKLLTIKFHDNLAEKTQELRKINAAIAEKNVQQALSIHRKSASVYEKTFLNIMEKYKIETL